MNRPDLDALAALLDKATRGPWRNERTGDNETVMRIIHGAECRGGSEVCIVTTGSYDDATEAKNAALIVAAVNALPALIARVRELERENGALGNEAETMRLRAEAAESELKEARYDNDRAWEQRGALAMRERCAQACEELSLHYDGQESEASSRVYADLCRGSRNGADACAAAIRALET